MDTDDTAAHEAATRAAIVHFLEIGRPDLALERIREALQAQPEDPELLVALGRACLGLDRQDEAQAALRAALAADPAHIEALALLAYTTQVAGHHREAESLLLAALALEPTNPGLLTAYARLLLKVGQLAKAEALAREALAQAPENANAHALLTTILSERAQSTDQATRHGRTAVGISPLDQLPHLALGLHLLRTGRPFGAKRHLREALRLDPRADVEQAFLAADLATRWCYLPMYYWGLAVSRLPGRQFFVWGLFMALVYGGRSIGLGKYIGPVAVAYLALVVYTWIATPLARAWVRWRPAR